MLLVVARSHAPRSAAAERQSVYSNAERRNENLTVLLPGGELFPPAGKISSSPPGRLTRGGIFPAKPEIPLLGGVGVGKISLISVLFQITTDCSLIRQVRSVHLFRG